MKRVVIPELLDDDLGTPEEIHDSLLDLSAINEKFGGFASIRKLLELVAQKHARTALTLLDVAGGTGDVVENVSQRLNGALRIHATILDRAVTHMDSASKKLHRVAGDALELPFQSGSFDVVSCNLFLHHLERDQIVRFFDEALRVARLATII